MTTYYEKLRDPRWQRRRLEIMQRADFACEDCGDRTSTLNVHHSLYRKGAAPWEYEPDELKCLCERCHEKHHGWKARLDAGLVAWYDHIETVVGYVEGRTLLRDRDLSICVESFEHAIGIADAFGLTEDQVIGAVDENRVVSGHALHAIKNGKEGVRGA